MRVTVLGSYAKALVMTTDRIPTVGETLLGRDYRETYGGKGSDMAVQAVRLGAQVCYLGAVGADARGEEFRDLMVTEGVDVSRLQVVADLPTGVGFIIKDRAAQNIIAVDMGANESFTNADVDDAYDVLRASDVVLTQLEIPLETALHGLRRAHGAGATTVLNPAPAVDLSRTELDFVDVLTPNETEAKVALGLPPSAQMSAEEAGRRLLARGARAVVITRGEAGALIVTPEGAVAVPGISVDVVDSNGAGDSFNAALSVGLGEGLELTRAVRFATVVAGLSCQHWETVPSYPTRAQVEEATTARS